MQRIVANQTVYWNDGSRAMQGRVKKILIDHAEVLSDDGARYIVAIAALSKRRPAVQASRRNTIITGG